MTSRPIVLAIDLGSSSFKAAVYGDAEEPLGEAAVAIEYDRGADGSVELDVRRAEEAFASAASGAIASAGAVASDCAALSITSQAQTYAVVDERGEAKTRFVSWLDARGREDATDIARRLPEFAEHCSFGAVGTGLQITKLVYLARTGAATIAPTDRVWALPAYLAAALTGRPSLDANSAAMTGLYSLRLGTWWPDALDLCGLRPAQLPDLVPVGTPVGRAGDGAARLGVSPGLPLVLAGNDQTAGAYGAGVRPGGDALLTIGSAHVAYAATHDLCDAAPGTARGPFPGGGHYVLASNDGGDVVRWAARTLDGGMTFAEFYRLAASAPPGCDGARFELAPDGGTGTWTGDETPSPANAARAVVEELAHHAFEMASAVLARTGVAGIRLAGGGLRADVWLDALSREFGTPLATTTASPALGAARMAQDALARAEA